MINENRTFNILIVDDVPKNIQVAANILQKDGYRMAFAQNGETALSQARSHRFDLILLDIMMPGMDGFEVCRCLRQDPDTRDIPVIFLTAKTDTESVVKGFELGATDYVTKPFNGAELSVRVRTHLELSHIREKLSEANATKDKFFTIIAHDLKNPFLSLTELSRHLLNRFDRLDEARRREYIQTICDTSKQTLQLLKNLLDWSRIQTDKMEFNPLEIGLHAIAYEAFSVYHTQAGEKNIELNSHIGENDTAYADPDMVTTIVRNLVSNAIKFTNPGGVVTVSSRTEADEVWIMVSDTGTGLDKATLDKLFRIDTPHKTEGTASERGTGIGLILCKEFVEKNGGRIWAENRPGQGSQFIFTLPKCKTGEVL